MVFKEIKLDNRGPDKEAIIIIITTTLTAAVTSPQLELHRTITIIIITTSS